MRWPWPRWVWPPMQSEVTPPVPCCAHSLLLSSSGQVRNRPGDLLGPGPGRQVCGMRGLMTPQSSACRGVLGPWPGSRLAYEASGACVSLPAECCRRRGPAAEGGSGSWRPKPESRRGRAWRLPRDWENLRPACHRLLVACWPSLVFLGSLQECHPTSAFIWGGYEGLNPEGLTH